MNKNATTLISVVLLLVHVVLAQRVLAQGAQASDVVRDRETIRKGVPVSSAKPSVRTEKRGDYTYVVGSVLIDAPPDKVWDILVDYDKSPEIFTNLSLCQVIGTEGEVKLVRQLVKPGGPIKFDYVVNLTESKPRLIKWKRRSGSFKEVMGTWELEPVERVSPASKSFSTSVTYSIHLDGGLVLPPWLLASQVKGYLPTVLNALKSRVESPKQGVKS